MSEGTAVLTVPPGGVAAENGHLTPLVMLEKAVSGGADVAVLERLMGLSERWEANQARKAFDAALSAMRGEMPPIVKTKTVDFTTGSGRTHYKYEDLAEITEALSPVLAKHGLSFRWRTDSTQQGMVSVTLILSHRDGHSEETTLAGPYDKSGNKNAIQAIGSVTTYLQRYTLKAALGIAAAADDDGRQGASQGQPAGKDNPQMANPDAPATDKQKGLIRKLMESHVITEKERENLKTRMGDGQPEGTVLYTKKMASDAIEWLQNTVKERKEGEQSEDPTTTKDEDTKAATGPENPPDGAQDPPGDEDAPTTFGAVVAYAEKHEVSAAWVKESALKINKDIEAMDPDQLGALYELVKDAVEKKRQ